MTVLIGGAWPYANGSLHIGHITALLPGDIIARYYRQKGEEVLYVSGSDCNGTPIAIRARQEGKTTEEVADYFHKEFVECFERLGFSYDLYTRTDSDIHHQNVQSLFLKLYENNMMYKKTIEQAYCAHDGQFLSDRLVEGECPDCGMQARGDQCDHCSAILDPLDLKNKRCKLCKNKPEIRPSEHLYFKFNDLEPELKKYFEYTKENYNWRTNAVHFTERYLSEGLPDRSMTRDLNNGVTLPVGGFEDKKIYVWMEAVAGYLSASQEWASINHTDYKNWWDKETLSYYVHGKDNIPFHSIIWPALLLGADIDALPNYIVSSEYMTLEKSKISTSRNWAVWGPDLIENYHPDSIRYFFTINAPEHRDADFSWREFIYSHNGELLGAFGNLVNRTFKFIEKSYNSIIPHDELDGNIVQNIERLYKETGENIEGSRLKAALENIFEFIKQSNKYFDEEQPWITVKNDIETCNRTIANCIYIIQNLSQLLSPFLPFSTRELQNMLNIKETSWHPISTLPNEVKDVSPLFERIDVKVIDEELEKLKS